ncbi:MAG: hypothetical protein DRO88_07465 [Promethearchaeia archaeon]|nr:MAG: hypothetical protein DRO88_07465 [Candidatus Lokiarchaeia archaeon]
MVFLQFAQGLLDLWVKIFGDSGAWMLIFCGLMALVWFFYEGMRRGWIRRKKEDWEMDSVSRFLKFLIFLGIVLGLINVITAVITISLDIPPSFAYRDNVGNHYDLLTSISLLVMGLAMFIKPLQDVPIATIVGLIAGAAVALLLAMVIPSGFLSDSTVKWILVIVFVAITSIVGALLKVWVDGIEAVAKFLSWPPIALVLAAYCIVQGLFVLVGGTSLFVF